MSHDPLDHGRRNVLLASGAAVALGLAGRAGAELDSTSKERRMSTLVIRNARITTLDPQQPHAQALAVQEGRIVAVGSDEEIMRGWGNEATLIDAQGRRLLPGLNDRISRSTSPAGSCAIASSASKPARTSRPEPRPPSSSARTVLTQPTTEVSCVIASSGAPGRTAPHTGLPQSPPPHGAAFHNQPACG